MKIYKEFKPISAFLSSNTESDDIRLALKILFSPWCWQKGKEIKKLEERFGDYFKMAYAFAFNSGRSALIAILAALQIQNDSEVLLQAFTCNAAINPILYYRAKPVFVDIDETLNLDPEDLKRKITKKSKVVIIQHTFGWPAKIAKIKNICKKYNLFLIEDCAHSLGAKYEKKLVGTFGDTAFFSFGRDKIISSVFGGMAITNNKKIAKKLKDFQELLSFPSHLWVLQQILHPLSFAIFLPIYSFLNIGKSILYLQKKLKILSSSVYEEEKKGKIPVFFPKRLPNALAIIALNQFQKIERFNKHRRKIAKFYREKLKNFNLPFIDEKGIEPVFMRFPILAPNSEAILERTKEENILLNNGWRGSPIIPKNTSLIKMQYKMGSCPRAEKIARKILNLPTSINIKKREAQKIIDVILKFTL